MYSRSDTGQVTKFSYKTTTDLLIRIPISICLNTFEQFFKGVLNLWFSQRCSLHPLFSVHFLGQKKEKQSLFVCVEVLRLSQPNGVMSSSVSLPNHTFTGQT